MNLGPLTTTFIPPASCASSVGLYYVHGTVNPELSHIFLGPVFEENPECLPPFFAPDHEAYYAPGVCPDNMVSVCESVTTTGTSEATVTVCCPLVDVEWDFGSPICAASDAEFMCHYAIDGPVTMSPITEITNGATYTHNIAATVGMTVTVHAHGVKVMAQKLDVFSVDDSPAPTSTEDSDSVDAAVQSTLPSLPSETASSTSTPAPDHGDDNDDTDNEVEGNSQDSQREEDDTEPPEEDDSAGLTTGQLAGIIVGSVLVLFLLLYLLFRKPRVVNQYYTVEHKGWSIFNWIWSTQK